MSVWEAGYGEQREEEREAAWEPEPAEGDDWRGTRHLEDWPESLAGPEYWLFKQAAAE